MFSTDIATVVCWFCHKEIFGWDVYCPTAVGYYQCPGKPGKSAIRRYFAMSNQKNNQNQNQKNNQSQNQSQNNQNQNNSQNQSQNQSEQNRKDNQY